VLVEAREPGLVFLVFRPGWVCTWRSRGPTVVDAVLLECVERVVETLLVLLALVLDLVLAQALGVLEHLLEMRLDRVARGDALDVDVVEFAAMSGTCSKTSPRL